jgi:hypothetical protein
MSSEDLSLSAHDLAPEAAERIRLRATTILDYERRLAARPGLARAHRVYTRYLEPMLVLSACVVYLTWAARVTLALLH